MRTLPHSSECGEFFCTSVHCTPTGDYSAKRLRKCKRKPHNFSRKLLFFPEKPVDFSSQLVHSSPHSLAICSFPHHNDKTVPTFRTQNPRKIAQSCVHLDKSRLLSVENRFSDASTPFQATLPRTLLCQKTAICAKSPLFCHFVAEKRPATWGFLQTFFIFAF